MPVRVIKVQGYEAIYYATLSAVSGNPDMVTIDGYQDVTRYWGYGEGNTAGPRTGDVPVTDWDFTNAPTDSTGDREWKAISITVPRTLVQGDVSIP